VKNLPVFSTYPSIRFDASAYSMILGALSAYAASDPVSIATHRDKEQYTGNMKAVDKAIIRTLAATGTVVTLVYCHKHGREYTPADPNGSYIENILLMMGLVEANTKRPNPQVVRTLGHLWILFADHEMTNSTAAFLHAASTLTDPISCAIASVISGFGPLHGGAIDIAYKSFERIGNPKNVPKLIADVKAKKLRLFGYGHRIYKTVDPRSRHIRTMIEELSTEFKDNSLLAVALEIDRIASKDSYFTSRNLKANADLYGSFIYTALYAPLPYVPLKLCVVGTSKLT